MSRSQKTLIQKRKEKEKNAPPPPSEDWVSGNEHPLPPLLCVGAQAELASSPPKASPRDLESSSSQAQDREENDTHSNALGLILGAAFDNVQSQACQYSEWRRNNTALYLQYLVRALKRGFKLPYKTNEGEHILKPVQPEDITKDFQRLQPFMFPPELIDRYQAKKSFKKYGHWKKVEFEWVELEKINIPRNYTWENDDPQQGGSSGASAEEVLQYWKKFIEDGIPIPAIRVYSDSDLTLISDGVQRMAALEQAGYKHALIYYRYETNEDPDWK